MAYNKTFTKKVKVKITTHICSECIGDFDAKDLFVAQVPDRDYNTIYCAKCLKELGITEFKPYHKVSEKKVKVPKPKTVTATKTKTGTATKTKTGTATKTKTTPKEKTISTKTKK